jgi:hypothetical protein
MDQNESTSFRNSKFRRELRHSVIRHYNLEELKILAHDLSVDWDSIPGESKMLKVKELIDYMDRRNSLSELTRELRRGRPNVNWPGYPKGSIVEIKFDYEVYGSTYVGEPILDTGEAILYHAIEGDYFDEGLAFAEAIAFVTDHVYVFEVEKEGKGGISEIHVSISNLKASIDLPSSESI